MPLLCGKAAHPSSSTVGSKIRLDERRELIHVAISDMQVPEGPILGEKSSEILLASRGVNGTIQDDGYDCPIALQSSTEHTKLLLSKGLFAIKRHGNTGELLEKNFNLINPPTAYRPEEGEILFWFGPEIVSVIGICSMLKQGLTHQVVAHEGCVMKRRAAGAIARVNGKNRLA